MCLVSLCNLQVDSRTHAECHNGDAVMEAIVKARNGSILGKHSILKMYFFPGQKKTSSYIDIPGAPHVYKVRRIYFWCSVYVIG